MRTSDPSGGYFVEEPWLYPGTRVRSSGLLTDGELLELGPSAQWSTRSLVVAVGSNASPAVLHRKLSLAGVSIVVPLLTATLSGIGVGHSAHVSRAGYLAAAPFVSPGAAVPVVASFLEADQLQALDATEPNYVRTRLAGARFPLRLATGEEPESFFVYVSKWGVLRGDGDEPLPLASQAEVLAHLRRRSPAFARFATSDDVKTVMRRLAADARHREDLRRAWVTERLVAGVSPAAWRAG